MCILGNPISNSEFTEYKVAILFKNKIQKYS
jgi:hypothetical protein